MFDRSLRQNAVTEIENMRPVAISAQDLAHGVALSGASRNQSQRIEMTLKHHVWRNGLRRPVGIDSRIETDRVRARS